MLPFGRVQVSRVNQKQAVYHSHLQVFVCLSRKQNSTEFSSTLLMIVLRTAESNFILKVLVSTEGVFCFSLVTGKTCISVTVVCQAGAVSCTITIIFQIVQSTHTCLSINRKGIGPDVARYYLLVGHTHFFRQFLSRIPTPLGILLTKRDRCKSNMRLFFHSPFGY